MEKKNLWIGYYESIQTNTLLSKGVNLEIRISFKPESEYEFTVDDEKLYRMYDHQITMYYELRRIKKEIIHAGRRAVEQLN